MSGSWLHAELIELVNPITNNNREQQRIRTRAGPTRRFAPAGPLNGGTRNWNGGIHLSFPFFDGMAAHGRALAASSALERQRIDIDRARDNVTLEARTSVDAVREASEIVRALSGTVEHARRLAEGGLARA